MLDLNSDRTESALKQCDTVSGWRKGRRAPKRKGFRMLKRAAEHVEKNGNNFTSTGHTQNTKKHTQHNGHTATPHTSASLERSRRNVALRIHAQMVHRVSVRAWMERTGRGRFFFGVERWWWWWYIQFAALNAQHAGRHTGRWCSAHMRTDASRIRARRMRRFGP